MIWLQVTSSPSLIREGVNCIITQNQTGNGALLTLQLFLPRGSIMLTARDYCTRPLQMEPCSDQIRLLTVIINLTNTTTGLFTEVLDNSRGSGAQV